MPFRRSRRASSLSGAEQEAVRAHYRDALPFRGKVRLKGAASQYRIVERYNVDAFKAQCSRPHMEA